ncbi:MAG TPA: hypothetical protein VGN49_07980 [Micrococcaceae bacterium]|nr:hypothetical protein [Micrococcaceae bacterium]
MSSVGTTGRIGPAFLRWLRSPDRKALDRLAQGWLALLPDADLMRYRLQGFSAAAADREISASVRQGVMDSTDTLVESTRAGREQIADFVARGLLLNPRSSYPRPRT